ncbi:MAG: F0F1 ATP synthase subunit alpha, partial [Clostridiales bacterium]|nr:F0F1 ATP synthase subunit alpha [Clostridiales bacterium]
PIIETLAGDVSAYIPTNVISITDGQIYLETELFFAGQRPAVNVGLSVSRVGGDAQIKAMKKIASPVRVNLAQYRELAVFAQFGSDLDKMTRDKLTQGERLMETLKQPLYATMPVEDQVIVLYIATGKYLMEVALKDVKAFNRKSLEFIKEKYPEITKSISETGTLKPEIEELLKKALEEFAAANA